MQTDMRAKTCGLWALSFLFAVVLFPLCSLGQFQAAQYPTTAQEQSATAPGPEFEINYKTGQLRQIRGNCERWWSTKLYHPSSLVVYQRDNSVFVLSRDTGLVAKITIDDACQMLPPQEVTIPGAEEILVDESHRAVYVAASGLMDLVRLDADTLATENFRTGVAAISLTLKDHVGPLLIAGTSGVASMDLNSHAITANSSAKISPKEISFKASEETPEDPPKDICNRELSTTEKQTLTLSNPFNLPIKLDLPDCKLLGDFKVTGNCTELRPHSNCEYVVSPPTPGCKEQLGEIQIASQGSTLTARLRQPQQGAGDAAPAYPGIRCSYAGKCDEKTFRRKGTSAAVADFDGPDKQYFVPVIKNCKGKKPGELCRLFLTYKQGSTNAVPEARVTVHTGCPGSIDFTAPVRVVPTYHAQPPARKKKS